MEISLEANLYVDIGPKRLKVALSHCSFLCMYHRIWAFTASSVALIEIDYVPS